MKKFIVLYAPYDKRMNEGWEQKIPDRSCNQYILLKERLERDDYTVITPDVAKRSKVRIHACLFLDIPKKNARNIFSEDTIKIALLRESEHILPDNFNLERHKEFDFILTWKRDLVDNKKYFLYPSYPYAKKFQLAPENLLSRKILSMVFSNLNSSDIGELYSERKRVAEWFFQNKIPGFGFFGWGWDTFRIILFKRTIFKFKLPKRFIPGYWRGVVGDKLETISKYKFNIAFENTCLINDYVSEKIIDCFFACTVPIYYGAPNIEDKIPKNCFIDYRNFKSVSELYLFIEKMSDEEYLRYQKNISKFIDSSDFKEFFSVEKWVQDVYSVIVRNT